MTLLGTSHIVGALRQNLKLSSGKIGRYQRKIAAVRHKPVCNEAVSAIRQPVNLRPFHAGKLCQSLAFDLLIRPFRVRRPLHADSFCHIVHRKAIPTAFRLNHRRVDDILFPLHKFFRRSKVHKILCPGAVDLELPAFSVRRIDV